MISIYNVHVKMESQDQCDRMKKVCIDNGLEYLDSFFDFWEYYPENNFFGYNEASEEFLIHREVKKETKVTEAGFLKLLENERNI